MTKVLLLIAAMSLGAVAGWYLSRGAEDAGDPDMTLLLFLMTND